MRHISATALLATSLTFSGPAFSEGLAVGQNPIALTQTRISNAGGGAGGNPHWGSAPYQNPWSLTAWPGYNTGEAFKKGYATDIYNGVALRGEGAPWDVDPGNSGNQTHGGNASNLYEVPNRSGSL